MELPETDTNNISSSLRQLIKLKSVKDGVPFTINKLATALNMPHSILFKLMHTDSEKRITNPKIETLSRIVSFFKSEGFNITIDDLLYGINANAIDVQTQPISANNIIRSIPLVSLESPSNPMTIGHVKLSVPYDLDNLLATEVDEDLTSIIKKGSLFVINVNATPKSGNLIAVRFTRSPGSIQFKKIFYDGNYTIFKSLNEKSKDITSSSPDEYVISGVVVQIQINAKN